MTTREYDITGAGIDPQATLAKARKLADRAVKKGLSGGYTLSVDTRFVGGIDDDGDEYGEEKHFLIVTGQPVVMDGWRYVAAVSWNNSLPIIATHPDYPGPQVDRAALAQGECDHCGVKRNRNYQVVVESLDTGERKTVGSSCLKDFLGHTFSLSIFTDPFEDKFGNLGGRGTTFLSADSVLVAASRIIRDRGFVSRQQADCDLIQSSADLVTMLLIGGGNASNSLRNTIAPADDEDRENAAATLAWVESETATSDWMLNLQAVLSADDEGRRWVPMNQFGLVTSAVGVWMRNRDRERTSPATVVEEFVGQVGEKVELEVEVVAERAIHHDLYGTSIAYTFLADDHRFEWVTKAADLAVGQRGFLKGSVKRHQDYLTRDGSARKTTILTRCKFASAV